MERELASKLILGTAQFGLKYGINNQNGKPKEADSHEVMGEAHKLGIRSLDTADVYGDAQEIIARYPHPKDVFKILSKVSIDQDKNLQNSIKKP